MAERHIAVGLSSEYLRIGVEPPIVDESVIARINDIPGPSPNEADGASVFFVPLPEGLDIQASLRKAVLALQEAGDTVKIYGPVVFGFENSNNPLEVARQAAAKKSTAISLEFFDAPVLTD